MIKKLNLHFFKITDWKIKDSSSLDSECKDPGLHISRARELSKVYRRFG